MNKTTVAGLSFVVGAGSGILGTYFYMRRKMDAIIDETIQEFKANYHSHSLPDDISVREKINPVDADGRPLTKVRASISNAPVDIERTQYHKLHEAYDKSEIDNEISDEDLENKTAEDVFAEAEHPVDGDEEPIHLINLDTYEENDPLYLKETLIWYTGDDVLVSGDGDVIEDVNKVVGGALDHIDWNDHDVVEGDLIYIRNDVLHIDYEIECIHANHKDMI